jgi:hypothetical protein
MCGLRLHRRHSPDILPRLDRGTVTHPSGSHAFLEEFLIRYRLALASMAALLAFAFGPRPAGAAAEVHRLNLVISGMPTQITGGDVNDVIDQTNRVQLEPRGLEGLDQIKNGWMFEGQLRYMATNKICINVGVGQIKKATEKEYLPAIQQDIRLRYEVFSVPVTVGGAYYMQPYNQGDFQARFYTGGGFLSLVQSRFKYQQTANGVPGVTSFVTAWKRDAPGFYVEGGVHMFFASRFSVMLGAIYRSAKVEALLDRSTNEPGFAPDGYPLSMDLSGIAGRMGLAFGF